MTVSRLSLLCRDLWALWLLLKAGADEIMHQDIVPLCAADIQDQLKKRFAYLSGGRGQDGSPVITFPDYPAFSEIPDKEFQNVMTYLTSIPSGQQESSVRPVSCRLTWEGCLGGLASDVLIPASRKMLRMSASHQTV
uniref:MCF.2 cell line derived transforming sequence like n=1 Tax=Gorilla gorilla gorilla TaxID=9595 RepID=A0A2I2ZXS7_GORGO